MGVESRGRGLLLIAKVVSLVTLAIMMIQVAWLSDDALITLRHALNASHGWGPGFNATESVQGFTHPLWFLFIALVVSIWSAPVLPILAFGILSTLIAVALIVWRVSSVGWVLVGVATLGFSNSFIEYSSSGLENGLAYLGFSVALLLTIGRERSLHSAILLGLTSAALLLMRLDFVLILVPVLLVSFWQMRMSVKMLAGLLLGGLTPLLVWVFWALSVYGEILPNTYYAKRNVDIPQAELALRGVTYLWVSFTTDPVTFFALAAGLSVALILGRGVQRTWSIGTIAYLCYVVSIGGDHMVGRYLAAPVLISVGLLLAVMSWKDARSDQSFASPRMQLSTLTALAAITLILVVLLAAGKPPVSLTAPNERRWDMNEMFQIQDERGLWAERGYTLQAFLAAGVGGVTNPTRYGLVEVATAAREWPQNASGLDESGTRVDIICGGLGTYAILSGPEVHWIDTCALTDAFLARKTYKPSQPFDWFMGHFERDIPAGYVEAVEEGDVSKLVDPSERVLLEDLWLRIR